MALQHGEYVVRLAHHLTVGGKQYVTIVGGTIFTFGLFEPVESTPIVDKGREP